DVLLDQTYARNQDDYRPCVPANCRLLCGSEYALLRPEFASLRKRSLIRRSTSTSLDHLLITMSGVDMDNVTARVLEALEGSCLPAECEITIVMGMTAPWLEDIRARAARLPWRTRVRDNVRDMACLMTDADLCIGASGSTAWERCALGLPTILAVTAANQAGIAAALDQGGAALSIGSHDDPGFAQRLQAAVFRMANDAGALRAAS